MVCEHVALMDMLYDGLFHIPEKFVEEFAEFRKRVGRRKGGQKKYEATTTKKTGWEVIICGGCDESDESDSMLRNQFDKFAEDRVAAFTGREGWDAGAGMYSTIIPTPTWRKIGGMDSDASSASTFIVDGKMGRSRPAPKVPRGRYAMGAPRTNTSHCMTTWAG